jgi:predicted RNA-binding Zn-ribbon protein involved in translation (DUF1610 family)
MTSMEPRWIKPFIYSAGGILLAAALIRFIIAAGNAPALALPEPMLGIPLRYAVLMVGGIELVVAGVCLFGKQVALQAGWLAWLAGDFLVYQIGLLCMHCHPQATCIGSLTDPLRLARGTTGIIMAFLPLFLLLGSFAAVICLWLAGRMPRTIATIKMFCSSCGAHIEFASQNLGRKIPCPLCKTTLTLRAPENLKMSCSFCKEHIQFPVHAIGQKIPCPHCGMGITLKEPA